MGAARPRDDIAVAPLCETSTPKLSSPPRVRMPKVAQGAGFAFFRTTAMRHWIRRHGPIFEIDVPFFGRSVVVSDPDLVRSVYAASTQQLINVQPNMSNLFGPGSTFALDGTAHRERRRLLASALHGSSVVHYEQVVEQETLRESMNWPQRRQFRILEPMNRITFNVILRTIFGADCEELEELRVIVPPFMKVGQKLAFVPAPPLWTRPLGPWRRLDDFRMSFNRIVLALIARAESDRNLAGRTDLLAMLVRAGTPPSDICDEVLTFIGAGHETTASALGWAFERLRRHPKVLAELVSEIDQGGGEFRRATVLEVLRARTVIDVAGRRVVASNFDLGGWRIPRDHTVLVRIADVHENPAIFPHPERFDPERFRGTGAAPSLLAFGGGSRRCIGAGFAIAEMDVVLRTVLRNFTIHTDTATDEASHFRGVAHVPKFGGLVEMKRRT
jgi:cytochrome P450